MLRTARFTLLAATACAVALAIGAPAGNAATWRKFTEHPGSNNDNPSLVRTADGVLHVAYLDHLSPLDNNFRYRTLAANGATFSAPTSIVEHWAGLAEGAIIDVGGVPTAIFGGQRTTDAADPASSGQAWAASLGAGAWTLIAVPVSTSSTPYASSQVSATVDNTGVPWFSWSTTFGVGIHQSTNAAGFEDTNAGPPTCCGYGSNLAKDAVTGDTYLVYQSNATGGSGYWSRRIAPALGDAVKLPDSSRGDDAIGRIKRLAAAPRTTGGVFTAYCAQYPSCTIVQVSDGTKKLALRTGGAGSDSVWTAAAPAGRLWLSWEQGDIVYAVRSNKALTKWGAIQKLGAPSGTTDTWYTYGEGSRGPLDLFVNVTGAGSQIFGYQTHVLPALSITSSRTRVLNTRAATVRFRVTDAGDAVTGTVRFRGVTKATNAAGYATFTVPMGARTGSFRAVGKVTGYAPASTPVAIVRPRR